MGYSSNIPQVSSGLDRLVGMLAAEVAATVDAVTHAIDGEIHSRTPVWSGKAVRNMIWSVNTPNTTEHEAIGSGEPGNTNSMPLGTEPRRPANEAAAQATLEVIKISRPFGIYYLSNVASHIEDLEHGLLPSPEKSRAPAGMFGVTYETVTSMLRAGAFK